MTSFSTLVHGIAHWAQVRSHHPAVHGQRDGNWFHHTWFDHWERVRALARGLIDLGHQPGQAVALLGANSCEWVECQFAVQAAAGVSVPLYATSTPAQLAYILNDVEAEFLVCQNELLLGRVLEAEQTGAIKPLRHIVLLEGPTTLEDPRTCTHSQLMAAGQQTGADRLDGRIAGRAADDLSSIIYTSGTTGEPKGVMLNDRGQLQVLQGLFDRFPPFQHSAYRVVSYLPLSHQAEQLVTNVGTVRMGGEVYFCPDIKAIRDYLVHARPTLFLAVPRVWEKFEAALRARLGQQKGVAKRITDAALWLEGMADRDAGRFAPVLGLPRRVSKKLVFDKIRHGLGLDQLEVALAGSAPMEVATLDFFRQLGIPIYEAYGLTENSGVATCNVYQQARAGTVGPPLSGVDVRLADDGEVLIRTAANTVGYYRKPEATAQLYTADGYLTTGDLGEQLSDGSLRIIGRKKELLITAGGKNVAPLEIESVLNRIPGVGQSVVVGDRMPYLCALITLDPEALASLANEVGVPLAAMADLAQHPAVQAHLWAAVDVASREQLARYQQPKKITVLDHEFTVEDGQLTPSMKLRRAAIAERYAAEIAALYGEVPNAAGSSAVASKAVLN